MNISVAQLICFQSKLFKDASKDHHKMSCTQKKLNIFNKKILVKEELLRCSLTDAKPSIVLANV